MDFNLQDVAVLKPEMTIFGEEGGVGGGVRGGPNVSTYRLYCVHSPVIKD